MGIARGHSELPEEERKRLLHIVVVGGMLKSR
jgi:hypothetical protein